MDGKFEVILNEASGGLRCHHYSSHQIGQFLVLCNSLDHFLESDVYDHSMDMLSKILTDTFSMAFSSI